MSDRSSPENVRGNCCGWRRAARARCGEAPEQGRHEAQRHVGPRHPCSTGVGTDRDRGDKVEVGRPCRPANPRNKIGLPRSRLEARRAYYLDVTPAVEGIMPAPKDPRNYKESLKAHLVKVPAYPQRLLAGSPVYEPAKDRASLAVKFKDPNFKLDDNQDYKDVCGLTHTAEVRNWVGGGF